MKIIYTAKNINCQKCANSIKNGLDEDFGTIEVNLDKNPREITIILNSKDEEEKFISQMQDLGFDIIEEISRV